MWEGSISSGATRSREKNPSPIYWLFNHRGREADHLHVNLNRQADSCLYQVGKMKPIGLVTATFMCMRTHKYFNSVIMWTPKFLPYAKIYLGWERGTSAEFKPNLIRELNNYTWCVKPIGSLINVENGEELCRLISIVSSRSFNCNSQISSVTV